MIEDAFIDLSRAVSTAPKWVINDFVPVGLTWLAGPPKKSFKSTLAIVKACICARWGSSALPPWAYAALTGPTMMLSCEADEGEVRWVVEEGLRLKVQPATVYVAHDSFDFQLDIPEKNQALIEYLRLREPALCILDPVRNCWNGDENDSSAVMKTFGPIREWAHDADASCLAVHHVTKPAQGYTMANDPVGGMYTMRGSGALPGLADGILVIEPTKHEGQIIVHATFKRGKGWTRTLQLGVPGFGWPTHGYEILGQRTQALKDAWLPLPASEREKAEVAESIYAVGKGSPGTVNEDLRALLRNNLVPQLTAREGALYLKGPVSSHEVAPAPKPRGSK